MSVLLTLILFTAGGVAFSFFTLQFLGVSSGSYIDLNFMGYYYVVNGSATITGVVFNNQGQPIPGATVTVSNGGQTVASTTSGSNGAVLVHITRPSVRLTGKVEYGGVSREFHLRLPPSFNTGFSSIDSISNLYYFFSLSSLGALAQFGDHLVIVPMENATVHLEYYSASGLLANRTVEVTALKPEVLTLPVPHNTKYVTCSVTLPDGKPGMAYNITVYPYTLLGDYVVREYPTALGLFSSFFPFVVAYLGYSMFSTPRNNGSLEFLLARPITKRELYFNRYLSNLLTVVIASLLVNLAALLVFTSFIGLPPLYTVMTLEVVSLSAYMAAFLSLTYMGGGISRYKQLSIAIPIAMYFVSVSIGAVTAFNPSLFWLIYLTPSALGEYISSYLLTSVPVFSLGQGVPISIPTVSLPLSIASSVLWVVVPLLIGYLAFKKEDI
ncbi:ABC transporter permease subunit [Stygiolobus caldivivus]|uniref:Uncharacterized protein n=1 Tax=Stygiolobus caldivivus TaxID=2824673 RepID=A0A8D5ZJ65_9CREN|nr:ABC transporter permease subunit [Stygiolobus caldivivus]BCU69902.1 hypothetical protein KN1_11990 [Stygiolobus caldivivus]